MVRIEPHAAVRGRSAEPRDFVSAVNGVAAMEENRIRHRRIVIEPREPAPRHHLRVIGAGRRDVAVPGGRHPPVIARHAVDADLHGLAGAVDIDDNGGVGALAAKPVSQKPYGDGSRAKQAAHCNPPSIVLVDSAGNIVAPSELAKKRAPTPTVNRLPRASSHETAGAFPLDFRQCPSICSASAIRIFPPSASWRCCATPAWTPSPTSARRRSRAAFRGSRARTLAATLAQHGMTYLAYGDTLGGRPRDAALYRDGVADYEAMARQPEFQTGLDRLCRRCGARSRLPDVRGTRAARLPSLPAGGALARRTRAHRRAHPARRHRRAACGHRTAALGADRRGR